MIPQIPRNVECPSFGSLASGNASILEGLGGSDGDRAERSRRVVRRSGIDHDGSVHLRLSFVVVIAALSLGCDDEKDPVDVPFEGIDVSGAEDDDEKAPPPPPPTATETAAPKPAPRPVASRLSGCCAALRGLSSSSSEQGNRRMYDQAAKVCSGLTGEVTRGKLTEAQALAQVRGSLLGSAPSACK